MLPDPPSYADLPRVGRSGQACAWGVFGESDRIGRLNLADPDDLRSVARELIGGTPIALNWRVDRPSPGILNRTPARHHVVRVTDGWDDYLDGFFPQGASQWDALCHCRHPELGYYNGFGDTADSDDGRSVRDALGIHVLAERGIGARFVLADVAGHHARTGQPWSPMTSTPIGAEMIEQVLAAQGTTVRSGDVLLLRTGWIGQYESLDEPRRTALAAAPLAAAGLAREESLLEWLWNSGIAAIAADNPTLEVAPVDVEDTGGFLHYRLIPLLGFLLGELFTLDGLAEHCAEINRWHGMLVSAPLNIPAGVGSPANAVAFV